MPHLTTDDGIMLFYEETGAGIPIVFVHEFAGDHRSYEPQVRYFSRRYRCITYNARYPDRVRSLVIAGCGYGAAPGERQKFIEEAEASAKKFETLGMAKASESYAIGPTRVQFQNKDPRGWKEVADQLAEHSSQGSALTMRGVQKRRPSLFDLVDKMQTITAPALIMTGDEDWSCLEPALLMKRTIPTCTQSTSVLGRSAIRGRWWRRSLVDGDQLCAGRLRHGWGTLCAIAPSCIVHDAVPWGG